VAAVWDWLVQSPILPSGSGTLVNPLFQAQRNEAPGGTVTK